MKTVLFLILIALISACEPVGTNTPIPPTETQAPIVTPEFEAYIDKIEVYDIDLGQAIYEIREGDNLNVSGINYTIRITTLPTFVQKVEMYLNDSLYRSESYWPYSLSPNNSVDGKEVYEPLRLFPGNYNLKVIVYNNNTLGQEKSINFSITILPTQIPSQPLNSNWDFKNVYTKDFIYFGGGKFITKIINIPTNWEYNYDDGIYAQQIDKVANGLRIYYHDSQGTTTLSQTFELDSPTNLILKIRYRWEIFILNNFVPEYYTFKIFLNDQLLNQNFYPYNNNNNNDVSYNLSLEKGFYTIRLEFWAFGNGTGDLYLEYLRLEK